MRVPHFFWLVMGELMLGSALTISDWIQLPIGLASAFALIWGLGVGIGKLNTILHQVQPNGGSTMSDRVLRTERLQAIQTRILLKVLENQGGQVDSRDLADLQEALSNVQKNRPARKDH